MRELPYNEISNLEKSLLNLDNFVSGKAKKSFSAFFGQSDFLSGMSFKNSILYGPNIARGFHDFYVASFTKRGFEEKGNFAKLRIDKILKFQRIMKNYQPKIEEEIKRHEEIYDEKKNRLEYQFGIKRENIKRDSIGFPIPEEPFENKDSEKLEIPEYNGGSVSGNGILDRLLDKNGNFGRKSLPSLIENLFKKSTPREKFEEAHIKESPYKVKLEVKNFVRKEFPDLLKEKYIKKELKSFKRMRENLIFLYLLEAKFDKTLQDLLYSKEFFKDYLSSSGSDSNYKENLLLKKEEKKRIPVRIKSEEAFAYI